MAKASTSKRRREAEPGQWSHPKRGKGRADRSAIPPSLHLSPRNAMAHFALGHFARVMRPLGFAPTESPLAWERIQNGQFQCVEVMSRGADETDGSVFRVRVGSIIPSALMLVLADVPNSVAGSWHLNSTLGTDPPLSTNCWWRLGEEESPEALCERLDALLTELVPRFFRMADRLFPALMESDPEDGDGEAFVTLEEEGDEGFEGPDA